MTKSKPIDWPLAVKIEQPAVGAVLTVTQVVPAGCGDYLEAQDQDGQLWLIDIADGPENGTDE